MLLIIFIIAKVWVAKVVIALIALGSMSILLKFISVNFESAELEVFYPLRIKRYRKYSFSELIKIRTHYHPSPRSNGRSIEFYLGKDVFMFRINNFQDLEHLMLNFEQKGFKLIRRSPKDPYVFDLIRQLKK